MHSHPSRPLKLLRNPFSQRRWWWPCYGTPAEWKHINLHASAAAFSEVEGTLPTRKGLTLAYPKREAVEDRERHALYWEAEKPPQTQAKKEGETLSWGGEITANTFPIPHLRGLFEPFVEAQTVSLWTFHENWAKKAEDFVSVTPHTDDPARSPPLLPSLPKTGKNFLTIQKRKREIQERSSADIDPFQILRSCKLLWMSVDAVILEFMHTQTNTNSHTPYKLVSRQTWSLHGHKHLRCAAVCFLSNTITITLFFLQAYIKVFLLKFFDDVELWRKKNYYRVWRRVYS